MFKKIEAAIADLRVLLRTLSREHLEEHVETRKAITRECMTITSKLSKTDRIIASQQLTIEQLTSALQNKYEHGLFVLSEDGTVPIVIRNGQVLTADHMTGLTVRWSAGSLPTVEPEYMAGTWNGVEV